jgi:hypothetical protein
MALNSPHAVVNDRHAGHRGASGSAARYRLSRDGSVSSKPAAITSSIGSISNFVHRPTLVSGYPGGADSALSIRASGGPVPNGSPRTVSSAPGITPRCMNLAATRPLISCATLCRITFYDNQ